MNRTSRQSALTLVEMLAVLAIIAILFAIGVPAARKMIESFDSSANVRTVISAALGHARSLALSEGVPAGLRFQQDKLGNQYMILIQYDYNATGLASGFRASDKRKPMKLPESVGVMDLIWYNSTVEEPIANDAILDPSNQGTVAMTNTTTFSIVFSKEGHLLNRDVQVMVRDVKYVPPPATTNYEASNDDIFNTKANVDAIPPKGKFYQDAGTSVNLYKEPSRSRFVIYEKKKLAAVPANKRWSMYLSSLSWEYVNPATGELVGLQ